MKRILGRKAGIIRIEERKGEEGGCGDGGGRR